MFGHCKFVFFLLLFFTSTHSFAGTIVYKARCHVTGYSDQDYVGPAPSVMELKNLCDLSKPAEFRDRTYLGQIETTVHQGSVLFKARCHVRGYSDQDYVGPTSTIADLKSQCDLSKPAEFRDRTYLGVIEIEVYQGTLSFKARCHVRGYSDQDYVGPAASIQDLKFLCDMSKPAEFRDRTYLGTIETETHQGSVLYKARCHVRGYSDQDYVGPAGNIYELKSMCDLSKPAEFRDRTYLGTIETVEFSGTPVFKARCHVRGYSDQDYVGPAPSIDDLMLLCNSSKPAEFRDRTYLGPVEIIDQPGTVLYKARCRVRGYSDQDWVGPTQTIQELKYLCDLSKPAEFRDRTYIDSIETQVIE